MKLRTVYVAMDYEQRPHAFISLDAMLVANPDSVLQAASPLDSGAHFVLSDHPDSPRKNGVWRIYACQLWGVEE